MRILVIGGTKFLGRHIVEAARVRGHEVTMFNRGLLAPDLFPDIARLPGDRDGDLSALRGRRWEAVVDTCGYFPTSVRRMAEALGGAVEHYTFISSISVYEEFREPDLDERIPVREMTDEQVRTAETTARLSQEQYPAKSLGELYGPLKARCERAAAEALPGRVLNVRAGLIVGPHDYSDRFTYWVRRVARGGEVLAPDIGARQVQLIDVRDLAEWIVRMAEARTQGTFNATGPDYPLSFGRLLEECRETCASDARFTWVSERFLVDEGVGPWGEMPLWVPDLSEEDAAMRYFLAVNCARARAAGLRFRPLAETIRDTLAWDRTRRPDEPLAAGLNEAREAELLRHWHARARLSP